MKKRLWIVKREVWAETLEKAIKVRNGRIYGVEEAAEKYQNSKKKKLIGFGKKPIINDSDGFLC